MQPPLRGRTSCCPLPNTQSATSSMWFLLCVVRLEFLPLYPPQPLFERTIPKREGRQSKSFFDVKAVPFIAMKELLSGKKKQAFAVAVFFDSRDGCFRRGVVMPERFLHPPLENGRVFFLFCPSPRFILCLSTG